jgi:hypothetical protein
MTIPFDIRVSTLVQDFENPIRSVPYTIGRITSLYEFLLFMTRHTFAYKIIVKEKCFTIITENTKPQYRHNYRSIVDLSLLYSLTLCFHYSEISNE